LPLIGIPSDWKTWIYVVIGLLFIWRFFFERKIFWKTFLKQKTETLNIEINVENSGEENKKV